MVHVEERGNITILNISGNLEIKHATEMEGVVNDLITGGKRTFLFDLGEVTYLSSSGIRVFISTIRQLKELKGRMVLSNPSESVMKTLKMVELDVLFEIMRNTDDAIKMLRTA